MVQGKDNAPEHCPPWVYCTVLVATLIGRTWRKVGDTVALYEERAKKLKKEEIVDYSKGDLQLDVPFPVEEVKKVLRKKQGSPGNAAGSGGGDTGNNGAGDEESFKSLGIVGKTAGLLTAGGIANAAELRSKVAEEFDLTSITGIGPGTANSILAALNPEE